MAVRKLAGEAAGEAGKIDARKAKLLHQPVDRGRLAAVAQRAGDHLVGARPVPLPTPPRRRSRWGRARPSPRPNPMAPLPVIFPVLAGRLGATILGAHIHSGTRPAALRHAAGGARPNLGSREIAMKLQDSSLFRQQCYIDGAWVDADTGATVDVTNPATGETIGTVPRLRAASRRRQAPRTGRDLLRADRAG